MKVLTVFGTRPEAVKMAPVVRELSRYPDRIDPFVCVTAQHRHMLDQVLDLFEIKPDYDLNIMQEQQPLTELTIRVLETLEPVMEELRPDWILVQGDTTSAMAASMAGFYRNIRVGHIEAGLRSRSKRQPFPEEINRRIISVIADLHFAPTEKARQSLLKENIPDAAIRVTGNTVIDTLHWVRDIVGKNTPQLPDGLLFAIKEKRLILVTGHRRESFGKGLEQICLALRDLADSNPDLCIVYPVHSNPNVREPVYQLLKDVERILLIDPLPYASFIWLMCRSYFILTDSGGIQEEAPSLGKPVLVMRQTTERPEGIEAGSTYLVGVNREHIARQANELLRNPEHYERMAAVKDLYGNGHAAPLIVESLLEM